MSYVLSKAIKASKREELKSFWNIFESFGEYAPYVFLNFVMVSKYMEKKNLFDKGAYKSGITKFLSYWNAAKGKMSSLAKNCSEENLELSLEEIYSLNVEPIAKALRLDITKKDLEEEFAKCANKINDPKPKDIFHFV